MSAIKTRQVDSFNRRLDQYFARRQKVSDQIATPLLRENAFTEARAGPEGREYNRSFGNDARIKEYKFHAQLI